MSDTTFQVVFAGEILDGFSADTVKSNLAKTFRLSPGHLDKLFSGNEIIVKDRLSREDAQTLQIALARSGAISRSRISPKIGSNSSPQNDHAEEPIEAPSSHIPLRGEWSAEAKKTVLQTAGAVAGVACMAAVLLALKAPASQSLDYSSAAQNSTTVREQSSRCGGTAAGAENVIKNSDLIVGSWECVTYNPDGSRDQDRFVFTSDNRIQISGSTDMSGIYTFRSYEQTSMQIRITYFPMAAAAGMSPHVNYIFNGQIESLNRSSLELTTIAQSKNKRLSECRRA